MLRRAAARAAARAAELAAAQRHCVQLAPAAEAAPVRAGGGAGPNAPPRARGFGAAAPPGSTLPLSFYDSAVEKAAMSASTEYSIKQMLEFGTGVAGPDGIRRPPNTLGEGWSPFKTLQFGRYVHRELPIRLARRLMDLHQMPYVVVTNPNIMGVYRYYLESFQALKAFPELKTIEDNYAFTQLMLRLVDESVPLLGQLARGVRECRRKPIVGETLELQGFTTTVMHSRIARRVIAEQYVALQRPREGFIGVFEKNMRVADMVRKAASDCEDICETTYGRAPEVRVRGDVDAKICYIPAHLEYILYEVFKNSARAVTEFHTTKDELPPIDVLIFEHPPSSSVTIKISDQGGGICAEAMQRVFEYGYTTVQEKVEEDVAGLGGGLGQLGGGGGTGLGGLGASARSPMAGLGFGLPLSRQYADYFGGTMELYSIDGYGTDVLLKLRDARKTSSLAF